MASNHKDQDTCRCENPLPVITPAIEVTDENSKHVLTIPRQTGKSDLKTNCSINVRASHLPSENTPNSLATVHSCSESTTSVEDHVGMKDNRQISVLSNDSGIPEDELSPQVSTSSIQLDSLSTADALKRPNHLGIKTSSADECSDTESPRFVTAPSSLRSSGDSLSSIERESPRLPRRKNDEQRHKRNRKKSRTEPNASALQTLQEVHYLGDDGEAVLKATLKNHAVDFRDSTDSRMLLAHLVKFDLVNNYERDFLNCEYRLNIDKSNKFYFTMLSGKGPTAYRKLYLALREEKTHAGHVYLVKIMTDELDWQRKT